MESLPAPNLVYLPLENKERVEVLKGVGAIYYGYAPPSGVVNMITKRADRDIGNFCDRSGSTQHDHWGDGQHALPDGSDLAGSQQSQAELLRARRCFVVGAVSAFFAVNHYESQVTPAEYQTYADQYVVPNMAHQMSTGAMTSYTMYLERGLASLRRALSAGSESACP